MQYANLGGTGVLVSRMALGAMTFGQGVLVGDWKTTMGQEDANDMVAMALDHGVNFFDTADMYTAGQSEMILGRALGARRKEVVVATKCGFRSGDGVVQAGLSRNHILNSVEGSLSRLGTEYIDLFLLHIPDPFTPMEETAGALDHVVRQGKVRYVGFCNHQAWQARKYLSLQQSRGWAAMATAQMYYSLMNRDIEHELVPMLRDSGMGLMVWSPLASGTLSGKYSRETPVPEGSRRAKFDFPPVDVEKAYEVVDVLKDMASDHKGTPAQIALAWLLAKKHVSSVIVGASRLEQLEENLGAATMSLSREEMDALDALTAPTPLYPGWMLPMGRDQVSASALGTNDGNE